MKLIEQHGGNALQFGVVDDHAGKHALGDHLDAGFFRDFRTHANAQSNALANVFVKRCRHTGGRATRCQTTRLEHKNFAALGPCFIHQRQGNPRRFTRTRRRDKDGSGAQA